jgi:hypothetical protein
MTRVTPLAALLLASALAAGPPMIAPASSQPATLLLGGASAITLPPAPDAAATAREMEALRRLAADRAPDLAARLRQWDTAGPVHRWNEIAVADQVDRFVLVAAATRTLALLHAATYDATLAAEAARETHKRLSPMVLDGSLALPSARPVTFSYPSTTAAVSEAASIILSAMIPDRADAYRAIAAQSTALRQQAGLEFESDAVAGRAIGAAIAAKALERARADGFDARWSGTVPQGPGSWAPVQGAMPYAPMAGTWQPYMLASSDALRPPPPPAFDSETTRAAIAELKAFQRTPKTNHDAVYWEVYGGARIYQLYNMELSRKVLEQDAAADPRRAAATYAAVNIALFDSMVACWDAKYTYWYARPHMLDAELRTVFAVPGHPSYPSAHSCLSMAATQVLAKAFPEDSARFSRMGRDAGEARIAAGIHYRFDIDAGNAIGQGVAERVNARLLPTTR